MRRRGLRSLVALPALALALLVGVPAATGTHDREHAFAGNWTIDPRGTPGQLKIAAVGKTEGLAAIRAISPSKASKCEFFADAVYYSGTFTTPTDNGPLAGCTESLRPTSFDGVYTSRTFAPEGPPGNIDLLVEYLIGGPQGTAFVTAPGQPEPVFGGNPITLRFDGHFRGDGADDAIVITWSVEQQGKGIEELGWISRSFAHLTSSTKGGGRLEYQPRPASADCGCGRLEPIAGDASANVIQHLDDHLGPDKRVTLEVTSGTAWGVYPGARPGLSLNVRVTASNTASCPIGRRGTITMDTHPVVGLGGGFIREALSVDLCGLVHSHDFTHRIAGDVDYRAAVAYPTEKPPARDLTPVRARIGVTATRQSDKHGRVRLAGGGVLRGPVSGRLTPVGDVDLVHTDARKDRELRLGLRSGFLRRDVGVEAIVLVARVERSNDPECPVGKLVQVDLRHAGAMEKVTFECLPSHAHLWLKGATSQRVDVTVAVSGAT